MRSLFNRKRAQLAFICLSLFTMILSFQNCGTGFTSQTQNSTTTGASSVPPVAGAAQIDFKTCRSAPGNFFSCLEAASQVRGVLKSADVDRCVAVVEGVNPSDFDVALCLTKAGFPIFGYRELLQTDVDTCTAKVGSANLAVCLNKKGVLPSGVGQQTLDYCGSQVGISNVEKCLRKYSYLAKPGILANADVNLCAKILPTVSGTTILPCLTSREVLPGISLVAADIDACLSTDPSVVAKCLRVAKKASRLIMQADINTCVKAVGVSGLAHCLEANGYLYDALLPAANLQTQIDSCAASVPSTQLASCLRANQVLDRVLMQPQIGACQSFAGPTNTFSCLVANGLVNSTSGLALNSVPAVSLNQNLIDQCANNGSAAGSISSCLVATKAALLPTSTQEHFNLCNRLADSDNIVACLTSSGMRSGTFTQEDITSCVKVTGISDLSNCLSSKGLL